MKFVIENKTDYQTRHLRAFVVRAYAMAKEFSGGQSEWFERRWRELRVRFARSNRRGKKGATGHAYLYGSFAHVGLGDDVDPYVAAYVIAHEIAHCFGMSHAQISGGALYTHDYDRVREYYSWAGKLPLAKVVPKTKPTAEVVAAKKRMALEARLSNWESKQRRAERAVKRLRVQLREFDRRQARKAAGSAQGKQQEAETCA